MMNQVSRRLWKRATIKHTKISWCSLIDISLKPSFLIIWVSFIRLKAFCGCFLHPSFNCLWLSRHSRAVIWELMYAPKTNTSYLLGWKGKGDSSKLASGLEVFDTLSTPFSSAPGFRNGILASSLPNQTQILQMKKSGGMAKTHTWQWGLIRVWQQVIQREQMGKQVEKEKWRKWATMKW